MANCQYCGDSFCAGHGERLADSQEICARPLCRRKKVDLEQHAVYKDAVAERNAGRQCGEPGCGAALESLCSKCRGSFCLRHLRVEEIDERRGNTVVRVPGALCRHCRRRRGLWKLS